MYILRCVVKWVKAQDTNIMNTNLKLLITGLIFLIFLEDLLQYLFSTFLLSLKKVPILLLYISIDTDIFMLG